ncbi:MAG: flagellar basal body-associated FliL family protein [Gemmatimonadaceae bacterium]
MSEQADADLSGADVSPPTRSGKRLIAALALAGLLLGGGGGFFLFAPAGHSTAGEAHGAEGPDSLASRVQGAGTADGVTVSLENIVVNPAATNGTRFLLVSAAFEVRDATTEAAFHTHELEIRDRVVAYLGSKTIPELTNPAQRDSLKAEILARIAPLFPANTVQRVHFPQFVIQ